MLRGTECPHFWPPFLAPVFVEVLDSPVQVSEEKTKIVAATSLSGGLAPGKLLE